MKMPNRETLPKELSKERCFKVATITNDNKKITVDPLTGKWLKGNRTTQKLYTMDNLESMNLHEDATLLQYVPRDTSYAIIDFDTDKTLSDDARQKQVDYIENNILKQFDGLVELSSSEMGVHAYVNDKFLKDLPSDPFKVTLDTPVGEIDVEIFAKNAPIVLTGAYFTDNLFPFDKVPITVKKAIDDRLSTLDNKTPSEAKPGATALDFSNDKPIDEDLVIRIINTVTKMDKDNRFEVGYEGGKDNSIIDNAMAAMILKASDVNVGLTRHILMEWMEKWRPSSSNPVNTKAIKNKCERAITEAYSKLEVKPIGSMAELVNKFSIPKAQREKLKTGEVDMFNGLIFRGQTILWIAMPNGGKTALAIEASKHMAKNGYSVFYLYEDSGLEGYANLADIGDKHGFSVLSSNNGGEGSSATTILDTIVSIANSGEDISKHVYVFDTMKKFTEVLDKTSIKALFNALRKINSKGGTVLLLGHAKKYYNEYNKLVYDGMGDILADCDAMYYIYHCGTRDKHKTRYFTIENEKDRAYGTTQEASFVMPADSYDIEFVDEVMDVRKLWFGNQYKEDIENTKTIIKSEVSISQTKLVNRVYTDSLSLSRKDTKKLLLSLNGIEWHIHKGAKNSNIYTLDDPASTKKKEPKFVKEM